MLNKSPLTETQSRVLTIIAERGKSNPVTGAQLSRMVDMVEKAEKIGANLRSVVNTLRDKGYPICAGSDGYYYPQSYEELKDYIESFSRRIEQQIKARDALMDRLISWNETRNMPGVVKTRENASQDQLFKFNGRID